MDAKKTNLTPELKEIYDRVMNTSAGAKPATPAPTAQLGNPLPPSPPPAAPNPLTSPPPPAMPSAPTTLQAPPAGMPEIPTPPTMATPAENALTNTPARPIMEGNTFSFSGTAAPATPPPPVGGVVPQGTPTTAKKKGKLSLPVIIVLGLVFLVVWGVFWAIIFGFIKR